MHIRHQDITLLTTGAGRNFFPLSAADHFSILFSLECASLPRNYLFVEFKTQKKYGKCKKHSRKLLITVGIDKKVNTRKSLVNQNDRSAEINE